MLIKVLMMEIGELITDRVEECIYKRMEIATLVNGLRIRGTEEEYKLLRMDNVMMVIGKRTSGMDKEYYNRQMEVVMKVNFRMVPSMVKELNTDSTKYFQVSGKMVSVYDCENVNVI